MIRKWSSIPLDQRVSLNYLLVTQTALMLTTMFGAPLWLTVSVGASSLLGIIWMWRITLRTNRMQRRRDAKQCLHCGYDLRATPDRCPECGTAVERPK